MPLHYLNYLCYLSLYSGSYVLYAFAHHAVRFPLPLLCHLVSSELGIWFGALFSELKSTPLRQLKQRHNANTLAKSTSHALKMKPFEGAPNC